MKLAALIFFLAAGQAFGVEQTLRFSTEGFSYLITEPDGWQIDGQSVAQIANFAMSKKGKP